MKKSKLFGNNIETKCEYCRNGSDFDGASVCGLGRDIGHDGQCRRFDYDPLKRQPMNLPPLRRYDASDFQL